MMKKIGLVSLVALLSSLFALSRAQALSFLSGPTLAGGGNITFETNGTPNGTTVQMTLDTPASVEIDFFQVSPVDSSLSQVAALVQNVPANISTPIFWNALWLIGNTLGRHNGTYSYQVIASTNGASVTLPTPQGTQSSLFTINSVDIHNVNVSASQDTVGNPTFPYLITYALAKPSLVTATIVNSSNTLVRTLLNAQLQIGENISTATVTWDGLGNDGNPVALGVYTLNLNAADPNSADRAIQRSQSIAVLSLAGAAADPKALFEKNAFVFPNPVRNGTGVFQFEAVRPGANISLKIYTLAGDLVLDKQFPNVAVSNIVQFPWTAVNQAGNKLGRGLYYYVVREEDSVGTLQTIKKMAVLP